LFYSTWPSIAKLPSNLFPSDSGRCCLHVDGQSCLSVYQCPLYRKKSMKIHDILRSKFKTDTHCFQLYPTDQNFITWSKPTISGVWNKQSPINPLCFSGILATEDLGRYRISGRQREMSTIWVESLENTMMWIPVSLLCCHTKPYSLPQPMHSFSTNCEEKNNEAPSPQTVWLFREKMVSPPIATMTSKILQHSRITVAGNDKLYSSK
jgi:hypothetical protein